MKYSFTQNFIPHNQFGWDFQSFEQTQSAASPSDSTTTSTPSISDEDQVTLASDHPKKNAGRKKFKETRHPVYRGVRRRNNNKWVCEVRELNTKSKRIWLGTYNTAEMAARAHDVAVLALRGRSVCLNFADSIWRLPVPESTDAADIRKAAKAAAEMFADHAINAASEARECFSPFDSLETLSQSACTTILSNTTENAFYIDEEAESGLQGLLANMEEGLLLYPHPYLGSSDYTATDWEDSEIGSEVSLWNFAV